jgi:hypothetical protein
VWWSCLLLLGTGSNPSSCRWTGNTATS